MNLEIINTTGKNKVKSEVANKCSDLEFVEKKGYFRVNWR